MAEKNLSKILITLLFFLVSIITLPHHARGTTIEEILKKNIEAVGGEEAIESINTIKMEAEVEIAGTGFKGLIRSYSMNPCLSYSEFSLKIFEIKRGFDGERTWIMDQNGKVQIMKDENSLKSQKAMCLISNFGYFFERDRLNMELAPPDTVEGKPCDVIKISNNDVGTVFLSFDRETHLLRRAKTETGLVSVETEYSDYRPVGGVLFPFKENVYSIQIMQKLAVKYTSIEVNEPIDPAIFFPPTSDVIDYSFTNDAGVSTIKMQYINKHIYIPVVLKEADKKTTEVHIKGQCTYEEGKVEKPVLFLLDSGASKSVIDSSLAVRLGFDLKDKLPGTGAGGMAYFYTVKLNGFTVGDIEFNPQTIFSFPISEITEKFMGRSIGGILGYDFLSRFVTEINYEDSSITFYQPDTFKAISAKLQRFDKGDEGVRSSKANGKEPIKCILEAPIMNNIFSFKGGVNDTCIGTFLLDTGANSSMLFKEFVTRCNLQRSKGVEVSIFGAGGEEKAKLARIKSFKICEYELKEPVASFSMQGKGISAFKGIDGIIGNDILERFNVVLDYRDQKVELSKNKNFDTPFFTDRAGIIPEFTESGDIAVHAVIPNSPAARARIRAGDTILKINGKRIAKADGLMHIRKAFSSREGKVVRLLIQRGKNKFHVILRLKSYI